MVLGMGLQRRVVGAFCFAFLLAACAGTSAIESQSRQKDARQARMYFLREQGVVGALGGSVPAAEIKVDGRPIGAVASGSYIFVDRSPATYRLSVQSGISMAFETDVQIDAGREYYFNVGVPRTGAIGTDFLNQAYAGGKGRPMQALSPLSSGFSGAVLYMLDASAGAAEVQRLKTP